MSESSGGAGGRSDDRNVLYFISCDYSTQGAAGQTINTYPWNDYLAGTSLIISRFGAIVQHPKRQSSKHDSTTEERRAFYPEANGSSLVNGIYQIKCDYLAPVKLTGPRAIIPRVFSEAGSMRTAITCRMVLIKTLKAGMFFNWAVKPIANTVRSSYYGGYYWRLFEFGQFGLSAVLLG